MPNNMRNKNQAQFNQVPNIPFYIGRLNDQTPHDMQTYHYHDCYELYYLYSGERYYFIKDKTYHITGGSFVLLNPYEIHSTGNLGKFGYDRMLIHFNKELIESYVNIDSNINPYKNLDNKIHVISLEPHEQTFVETLLHNMELQYTKNNFNVNGNIKISLIQLLLFLNECNKKLDDEALENINNTQKSIFEVVGYINNNYYEDINLELISKKFYLSTFYISRTFKEITGYSIIEYLNNVRIKEAKKLLLNTNLNISEISSRIGFKSNTHFGRVFKGIVGITPSAYKNK